MTFSIAKVVCLEGAKSCLRIQLVEQACAMFLVLWCCQATLQNTKLEKSLLMLVGL